MSASQNQDGGERTSSEEAEEMPPGQVQPGDRAEGSAETPGKETEEGPRDWPEHRRPQTGSRAGDRDIGGEACVTRDGRSGAGAQGTSWPGPGSAAVPSFRAGGLALSPASLLPSSQPPTPGAGKPHPGPNTRTQCLCRGGPQACGAEPAQGLYKSAVKQPFLKTKFCKLAVE